MLIHLTLSTTELKEIHLQCHISSIKENVKFLISVSAKGPFLEDANNILFSPCGVWWEFGNASECCTFITLFEIRVSVRSGLIYKDINIS